MPPLPTSRQNWIFSILRSLIVVSVFVLVLAWFCALAFYVRPAWLRGIASYGIYWRYAMPLTVHYVIVGLSVAVCAFAIVDELIAKQSRRWLRVVAVVCVIVGLITTVLIPILEPAW